VFKKILSSINIKDKYNDISFLILLSIIILLIFWFPIDFENKKNDDSIRVKGIITEVDNTNVQQFEIVKTGSQAIKAKILKGKFKGENIKAVNSLLGRLEFDKIFVKGEKVLIVLNLNKEHNKIIAANVIDHYRINIEIILLLIFILFILIFAGWTGFKAVFSFLFTAIIIWKILLPLFLQGYNPIFISLLILSFITSVIIFLIGGFTKKGLVAFLGAITGVALTCLFSLIFGKLFHINGAIKPFTETLLYSGFAHLDITQIFLSGIFIASSGAVMDIAMDIAASQNEVIFKKPNISRKNLILSGFSVGKAVVGTMTTTLLLAYSGGFTALLMVFIAQGTPIMNIFNINYVAGEILHILIGSFGLVLVAPLTAIFGGFIFIKHNNTSNKIEVF